MSTVPQRTGTAEQNGRCTGLHVNGVPQRCQEAAAACSLGIVLAMTGGLLKCVEPHVGSSPPASPAAGA